MPLFTRRERIAVAVIGVLVLVGWGIRFGIHRREASGGFRIIRQAVEPPESITARSSAAQADTNTMMIDINTADAALLETLPMIGAGKAEAIVRWRRDHGPFGKAEDLMQVPGIGPGIFSAVRDRIAVGDSTGTRK